MRAIHEIAWKITILNSTGYKTNYILLWRYLIKRISVTGQQKRVSRSNSKTLQVSDVQRQGTKRF